MVKERCIKYQTLDLSANATFNVSASPYNWMLDGVFDAVICSSTLEHIKFFWLTFDEMVDAVKPGGYIYINAPSTGPSHWNSDYWRFKADAGQALAEYGEVELISSRTDTDSDPGVDQQWHDTVMIFRKPI